MSQHFVARASGFQGGGVACRCVLGKGGVRGLRIKREGDGASPLGIWPMRRVFFRPDRLAPPQTGLDLVPLAPHDGWCDDPADPLYNRPVSLPYPARHEQLWRDEPVYDLIVELGYNDDPVVPGLGSAIFLHLMHGDGRQTEGCIALDLHDLLDVLKVSGPGSVVEIGV